MSHPLKRLLELDRLEEKVKCENDLAQFVRSAWHIIESSTELKWNWHLDTICGYLMAFDNGELPDKRLIICIPPGTMKSILVSVMYPAWRWIRNPHDRYLSITNEQGLAVRDALRMKDIITSDWYASKWPISLKASQNEKTYYVNECQGFRQSQGISAGNTGKRGDCVIGSTMVATEIGDIRIDDLYSMETPPMVWSFNHVTKNIELKKILAKKESYASKTINITALDGIMLTCTPCHRIYTSNGYQKAENISGCILSFLQRTNDVQAWKSSAMQKIRGNHVGMPDLQQRIQKRWCGTRQRIKKKYREIRYFLLKEMQSTEPQSRAIYQTMFALWKGVQSKKRKEKVLLNEVQEFITVTKKNIGSQAMRGMWKDDDYLKLAAKVLLYGLQKSCSFVAYDWEREFSFSFNNGQGWTFPQNERANKNSRYEYLYGMSIFSNKKKETANSSHRLECREQSSRESNNAMRRMSYTAPQILNCIATIKETSVVDDSRKSVPVYDIQVDGNSNFFANGILVHNCLLIDDPIDAAQAYSDVIRTGVNETWDRSLSSRLNDLKNSGILLIMQRVHQDDLVGHLQKKAECQWTVLSIPMRYEGTPSYDAGADIGRPELNDPRTVRGELMFPGKFSENSVKSLEEDLGEHGTSAQLQQRPVPIGGSIIKKHHWRRWPDDKKLPKCLHIFTSYDTAYSDKDIAGSAFSACTRWGVFWHDSRERYCVMLLGVWYGRVGYPELRAKVVEIDKKYRPDVNLIEAKSTGLSLIGDLKDAVDGLIKAYSPGKGEEKSSRAHSVTPIFEMGLVYVPPKSWADELIEYVASFPHGAPPSADLTDTVTQALIYLRNARYFDNYGDEVLQKEAEARNKLKEEMAQ